MVWISSIVIWIFLTLFAFKFGVYLNRRTGWTLVNPLIVAIGMVITILLTLNISYDTYNEGGKYITLLLKPATVALAIPLYKQFDIVKKNAVPVLLGCLIGVVIALLGVIIFSRFMSIPEQIVISILPKSITTVMGIEVSNQLGGVVPLTITAMVVTGVSGAILGPIVLKFLKIDTPTAVGVAMGTSSHTAGTSRANELGELQGAMSAVSIPIAGIYTILFAPIIWSLFVK